MVLNNVLDSFTSYSYETNIKVQASISHFMTDGGPDFVEMIQKENKMACIFFTCPRG